MRALRMLDGRREAIARRVAAEVGACLAEDTSTRALARAAERAGRALDEEASRSLSERRGPACSAGCASCCHVHVEVTEAEALAVASFLAEALAPEALEACRASLVAHVDRVASTSHEERWAARIPCAFLAEDGRCSVHAARPLRCRAFHSTSREQCERAFERRSDEEPSTIPALDRVHDAVEEGFERALAAAGVATAPLLLEAGVLRALEA